MITRSVESNKRRFGVRFLSKNLQGVLFAKYLRFKNCHKTCAIGYSCVRARARALSPSLALTIATINSRRNAGETPLEMAMKKGRSNVTEMIMAAAAAAASGYGDFSASPSLVGNSNTNCNANRVATPDDVRCSGFNRILHSRMALDPTHVRFKRTRVTNSIPLGSPLLLPLSTYIIISKH
jgi:ankyrin repeat protein